MDNLESTQSTPLNKEEVELEEMLSKTIKGNEPLLLKDTLSSNNIALEEAEKLKEKTTKEKKNSSTSKSLPSKSNKRKSNKMDSIKPLPILLPSTISFDSTSNDFLKIKENNF